MRTVFPRFASPATPIGNLYIQGGYTNSHFEVTFQLDKPAAFRHENLMDTNALHLDGPGGQRINLYGKRVITGQLTPGQWTLETDVTYLNTEIGHQSDFSLTVPEPAPPLIIACAALLALRRR